MKNLWNVRLTFCNDSFIKRVRKPFAKIFTGIFLKIMGHENAEWVDEDYIEDEPEKALKLSSRTILKFFDIKRFEGLYYRLYSILHVL